MISLSMLEIRQLLVSVLGPELENMDISESTLLLGEVPELDSIGVVNLILAMEEQFGIKVEDDDIDASSFESVATLSHYIRGKLNQ